MTPDAEPLLTAKVAEFRIQSFTSEKTAERWIALRDYVEAIPGAVNLHHVKPRYIHAPSPPVEAPPDPPVQRVATPIRKTYPARRRTTRVPQSCRCGCGTMTKGGTFCPGHDARLKGQLLRQWRFAPTPAGRDAAKFALQSLGWI